ncbi:hypothetical protein CTAYLR_007215 [Chrysophaeum taylorii]|uniref:EF-hand domain-containing protein n=1 Tax=Chrysophaeum taylorii TaxID=2483200 RepID=A0AAD7XH69_9STRA|nr:hypothetical protein CTAYLR_007215 [Chrysophaeum taylorii]
MGNIPSDDARTGAMFQGKAAMVGAVDPWEVFDALDDDMSGTIAKSEFKRSVLHLCKARGYTCLTKDIELEEELDALWAAVDASGRGVVDASEWSALVALIEKRRRRAEKPVEEVLEVTGPGAIVRESSSLSSRKLGKIEAGVVVRGRGRRILECGTERINVRWGDGAAGWVSAKRLAAPVDEDERAPESARWTDWVDWLRSESSEALETLELARRLSSEDYPERPIRDAGSSTSWASLATANTMRRNHNSARLLSGNLRFLDAFDEARYSHLRETLALLDEDDVAGALRELEKKMDALSIDERARLREALLGARGVAWRRHQEAKIAARLERAMIIVVDEKPWWSGRLARALHGAGLVEIPDPKAVSPGLVVSAVARLPTLSGSQILVLARWASTDEMLQHPACATWLAARDRRRRVEPEAASSSSETKPPAKRAVVRAALLTCVSVAVREAAAKPGTSIQDAIVARYARVCSSRGLVADLAPTRRVWAISDLHVDVEENRRLVLSYVAHPEDAIIVAGDVAPALHVFEEVMASLVSKYRHVFFCPGNHDLWVAKADLQHSLGKFFELLVVCDRLGVKTYPAHLGDGVYVVPLFSWYDPLFVDGTQADRHKLRFFDAACKWPDFLSAERLPPPAAPVVIDGVSCATNSLDPGIATFFRRLNRPAIDAVIDDIQRRDQPPIVLSFSHFVPDKVLYEGLGGVHFLGHTMGDAAIADDVRRLDARAHVFGHSHLNVDAVLDDNTRYLQNAVGHTADGAEPDTHPILIWDAHFAPPV